MIDFLVDRKRTALALLLVLIFAGIFGRINIPIENDRSELDKETIRSIFKLLDREVIFYNEEQNIINNKPDVDTIRIKN